MSKPLDRITLLETFVRIAEAGSISAAARDLGLSQPSASRQLAELEARFKTQLVRRSTHSLALTEAGVELLGDARELLDGWESLSEKHLSAETEVQGKLKVVAPVALGQVHIARIAGEFQMQHPRVNLTLQLEDQPIRFAEVGCDCWIKVGAVPDDTLVVRRVATVERLVVASDSFVAEHGMPKSPKGLEQRPLVALDPFEGDKLLLSRGKRSARVNPALRMRTNNIFALKASILMGVGTGILPRWFIADELASGELIDLLPGWKAPSLDVHVAYRQSRHQPLRLRALLEVLNEALPVIDGFA